MTVNDIGDFRALPLSGKIALAAKTRVTEEQSNKFAREESGQQLKVYCRT